MAAAGTVRKRRDGRPFEGNSRIERGLPQLGHSPRSATPYPATARRERCRPPQWNGCLHFEIRTYPEIGLREALLNALVHTDYRIPGPTLVKQFSDRIEIGNPGGLPGGITPDNILRHEPVPRNPVLADALTRLRLVNRSNLGVRRMYQSFLIEGKDAPAIHDEGEAVRVIFPSHDLSVPFRMFVAEEGRNGRILSGEQLLILRHLLQNPEIDTLFTARITQQREPEVRESLNRME